VLHSAPPPAEGRDDPRTRRALAAMHRARTWVYLSTTGVYGDCGGARFDETRAVAPRNDRAVRRVAAERALRRRAARGAIRATVLRVPGIYAAERLPLERLQRGTPALVDADDVHTNHVHADDLARIAFAALLRGRSQRTVHAVDDSSMKMGEYFDAVARAYGLPPPPRLPREALRESVSPMLWSFMSESRRLDNRRLRRELRVRLRWPTVDAFLRAHGGRAAS
jgi:nucleoside-diphosphate-sugar epimerase